MKEGFLKMPICKPLRGSYISLEAFLIDFDDKAMCLIATGVEGH